MSRARRVDERYKKLDAIKLWLKQLKDERTCELLIVPDRFSTLHARRAEDSTTTEADSEALRARGSSPCRMRRIFSY